MQLSSSPTTKHYIVLSFLHSLKYILNVSWANFLRQGLVIDELIINQHWQQQLFTMLEWNQPQQCINPLVLTPNLGS